MNIFKCLLLERAEYSTVFSASTTPQDPGANRTARSDPKTDVWILEFPHDSVLSCRPAPIASSVRAAVSRESTDSSIDSRVNRKRKPSPRLDFSSNSPARITPVASTEGTDCQFTDLSRKKYKNSLDPLQEPDLVAIDGAVDRVETNIRRLSNLSNSVSSLNACLPRWGLKCESYTYPLNQAIQAKSSLAILEAMIALAPDALFLPDGRQKELPLHVAIRHRPHEREMCDMLLLNNLAAATARDRHMNTALHIACSVGASIDIVRNLCAVNPFAVVEGNFHGLTPLDIALRRSTSSENVVDYLNEIRMNFC